MPHTSRTGADRQDIRPKPALGPDRGGYGEREDGRLRVVVGSDHIVEGLPDPIVRDGMIAVIDRPGMGVGIIPNGPSAILHRTMRAFSDDLDPAVFGVLFISVKYRST